MLFLLDLQVIQKTDFRTELQEILEIMKGCTKPWAEKNAFHEMNTSKNWANVNILIVDHVLMITLKLLHIKDNLSISDNFHLFVDIQQDRDLSHSSSSMSELMAQLKESEQMIGQLRSSEAELKRNNTESGVKVTELKRDIGQLQSTLTLSAFLMYFYNLILTVSLLKIGQTPMHKKEMFLHQLINRSLCKTSEATSNYVS